ncbi:response regulator [Heliobacterium gestii]|uniref:Stage 0 sporulation protein A homolog n=1 Tax=Heliomicrobium gestii TaxID=2699 RepID=A0A845LCE3_HELGE|nr:response regulator [Heliomicrobium gestii]MBM7867304.1 DNA-binding NarL/FixJ family response regulator [Heliomicrobium gestii]MZP43858.1 response regulator [Heliomicrobium gestii]
MSQDKYKILIVDDSPFSQSIIKNSLQEEHFHVIGMASTGYEGIQRYRELKPQLVTMDITMPDMDGLECVRRILDIDPDAKIVMISSMRDLDLIKRAHALGIAHFLQKPFPPEELNRLALNILRKREQTQQDAHVFAEVFRQALQDSLATLLSASVTLSELSEQEAEYASLGIAVVIGITGDRAGKMILDCAPETALATACRILRKDSVDDQEMRYAVAEIGNIIAGHGVSRINDRIGGGNLRLTSPSILCGKVGIINPKMIGFRTTAQTGEGPWNLLVGFGGASGGR